MVEDNNISETGTLQLAYKPFLNIYIVWHPGFGEQGITGRTLAEILYREFCRDPARPMSPALGAPIYFRTSEEGEGSPPPLDLTLAHHNVVVFLANSTMILDEAFRNYVREIGLQASSDGHHRVLSFLFASGSRLPLGNIQQIQLPENEQDRLLELRLRFAAECCRLLQNRPRSGAGGEKLSLEPPRLFISHAKRDAAETAEVLKTLVEKTSVDTFFDKVDIAAGYDFTAEIKESIKRSAVVAWQSDEYASRPWCNIELLTAKEFLRPIVVVLKVKSGEERSFPYLGNVRTIVATDENARDIIIAAAREYFRKLYSEGRFETLTESGLIPKARFYLFRPPEPIDGALLERKSQESTEDVNASVPLRESSRDLVLYPDPPLSTAELTVMVRLFQHIRFATPATIDTSSLNGKTISISISESHDLLRFGGSSLHLLNAMIEIARHTLCRGAVLAYGGDLREKNETGYTRQLLELIYAYDDLGRQRLERILSFLAHHIAGELPEDEEARLLELATFRKPLPENLAQRFGLEVGKRQNVPDDTPEHRYIRSRCLSAMRQTMCQETDARIVLGGRVSGHQGKYPGILEEAYLTLYAAKPLFILGGYGGCAKLLVRVLRDKQVPPELTRAYQAAHPRTAHYQVQGKEELETVPFEQLEELYIQFEHDPIVGEEQIDYQRYVNRFAAASIADLRNGLSDDENLELFETIDLDRIIYLVMKGLTLESQ